ncbi:MAG TPA: LPS export ABC transporter ATP-binding protein [Candidatus Brocadiaceae bacterium]
MALLQAQELIKAYGKRTVVNDITIEVDSGEIVGLLGKNGAGKSTAFSIIIGIVRPDSGKVFFRGEDVTNLPIYKRARKGMGYLSQESSVFQRMTVEQNILAILEMRQYEHKERYKRLAEMLDEFGLTSLAKKKAYTLSGGEKRRLEMARALSTSPSLILLDEPFSGIDPIAVSEIQNLVLRLKSEGIGLLITDHNVREALSITDHSYIISEGVIISKGTTQQILTDPLAIKSYLGEGFSTNDVRLVEEVAKEGSPF